MGSAFIIFVFWFIMLGLLRFFQTWVVPVKTVKVMPMLDGIEGFGDFEESMCFSEVSEHLGDLV